jgi:hypothetical protein
MHSSSADQHLHSASSRNSGGSSKSSSSQPFRALSSLAKLSLSRVTLRGFPGGLRTLSALTALQDVHLGSDINSTHASFPQVVNAAENRVRPFGQLCLQQLTQLTRFVVRTDYLPEAAVAPLSVLQQLQHLQLKGHEQFHTGLLAGLPASLTHLQFDWRQPYEVDLTNAPDIAGLTALQDGGWQEQRTCPGSVQPAAAVTYAAAAGAAVEPAQQQCSA